MAFFSFMNWLQTMGMFISNLLINFRMIKARCLPTFLLYYRHIQFNNANWTVISKYLSTIPKRNLKDLFEPKCNKCLIFCAKIKNWFCIQRTSQTMNHYGVINYQKVIQRFLFVLRHFYQHLNKKESRKKTILYQIYNEKKKHNKKPNVLSGAYDIYEQQTTTDFSTGN